MQNCTWAGLLLEQADPPLRRTSRAEAEDALARVHDAPGDVTAGVHVATGVAGAIVGFAAAISSL